MSNPKPLTNPQVIEELFKLNQAYAEEYRDLTSACKEEQELKRHRIKAYKHLAFFYRSHNKLTKENKKLKRPTHGGCDCTRSGIQM